MTFLLLSLSLFWVGGLAALFCGRSPSASRIGGMSAIAASVVGTGAIAGTVRNFFSGSGHPSEFMSLGKLPMGELVLSLDLLSVLFLLPVFVLSGIAALYGMENGDGGAKKGHTGAHWFFYNTLAGGMALTVTAADAFLFLLAWEIMSLAPFFLITMNDDSSSTRAAAWTYLVAAHLGGLFIMGYFALLSSACGGSLAFADFAASRALFAQNTDLTLPGSSGVLFLLAFIGFGTKAGFMPLHIWLPEAHPAAPSHVSAIMSGAMITMGIYGILRTLFFLGSGEAWWAYTLVAVGAFTGFAGIVQAMVQDAIKRSLAFSSVENMGIICMGLGIALLCLQNGHTNAAALAGTGSLVHLVNHSFSKGLLFLCAGSILHGSGSVSLRLLGGLQKRMPLIGWCFLFGSASIAALPPLNGFAGEFFIYLGMIFGGSAFAQGPYPEYSLVFWLCLFTLAGIGGFTLLCFARLYGIAFLGSARSTHSAKAHGPNKREATSLILLVALCITSTALAPKTAVICNAAISTLFYGPPGLESVLATAPGEYKPLPLSNYGLNAPDIGMTTTGSATDILHGVNSVFLVLTLLTLGALLLRRRLLRGKNITTSLTWDCGYIRPTARMQYTAGSFSRPAAFFMRTILYQKFIQLPLGEYFPVKGKASLKSDDWIETKGYSPLFNALERMADWCKELQHGRANAYILYILVTLVALLAWQLR